jgi:hypothetical protein
MNQSSSLRRNSVALACLLLVPTFLFFSYGETNKTKNETILQATAIPSQNPSSTAINTVVSTTTPQPASSTLTSIAASPTPFYYPGVVKFAEAVGTFIATILSFVVLFALVFGVAWVIWKFGVKDKVSLSIEAFIEKSDALTEHYQLESYVRDAFENLWRRYWNTKKFYGKTTEKINVLVLLPALIDILEIVEHFNALVKPVNPSAGAIDLKFSVGPVELGGVQHIFRRMVGFRDFHLSILVLPAEQSRWKLEFILTLWEKVWYRYATTVDSTGIEKTIDESIGRIAWAMSQKDPEQASYAQYSRPGELSLLDGLDYFRRYYHDPNSISLLLQASQGFHETANSLESYYLEAKLLEAVSLQLSQSNPQETVKILKELLEEAQAATKRRKKLRRRILKQVRFNYALASFYLYTDEGYQESIDYFNGFKVPWPVLRRINTPVWNFMILRNNELRWDFVLHVLAQLNNAITYAHMVHRKNPDDKNKDLKAKADDILAQTNQYESESNTILRLSEKEISWREENVKIMLALRTRNNLEAGINSARRALEIASYALDVKANLGSLLLVQSFRAGGEPKNNASFLEAEHIYGELLQVGWDLGFVKYRLGTIRRVQGNFADSIALLTAAKDPKIRDVKDEYLDRQLQKATAGDSAFLEEDV